jgi:hypothetical protein
MTGAHAIDRAPRLPITHQHPPGTPAPPRRRARRPRRWPTGGADTTRRRQRVIAALDRALTQGAEIGVSAIARAASVDRSFLYRHRDLLEKTHALAAEPPASAAGAGQAVTRASLQADLLAAHERAARLHTRIQQLEKRLSEALGEHAWQESGLGAPTDVDALNQQISHLEQQVIDLRLQLDERHAGFGRRPRKPTGGDTGRAPWVDLTCCGWRWETASIAGSS